MDLRSMTFVMACNSFFGRKAGQTLQEFKRRVKGTDAQEPYGLSGNVPHSWD